MATQITTGSMLKCSFGAAPSALSVLPTAGVMAGGTPAASIMAYAPLVNVMPFGTCTSMDNPEVVAATAAAMGVLTPMPCVPVTIAPWVPGAAKVLIGGMPALDNSCKLLCLWGGTISITAAAQKTVMVP